MTGVSYQLDQTSEGIAALARLRNVARDQAPAWASIAENLLITTKERFARAEAPDGTPWAPNSQATIEKFLSRFSTSFSKKTGRISAAGRTRAINKKPGRGESRQLGTQIVTRHTATGARIGSPLIYAGTFHFGAGKGAFGASRRGPIPWGDIPPRPIFGLSARDREMIDNTIQDFISSRLSG